MNVRPRGGTREDAEFAVHVESETAAWFTEAMRQRRYFFLFSYLAATVVGVPFFLASEELRGLSLFIVPLAALCIHFLARYMWQFLGPFFAQPRRTKDGSYRNSD